VARRDKLVELLNKRLGDNQVPSVKPAFDKNPVDEGSPDPQFWQMRIGQQLVASAALSRKQAQNLVETAWHEGRQSEKSAAYARLNGSGHCPGLVGDRSRVGVGPPRGGAD
jgi:hypothetical protein